MSNVTGGYRPDDRAALTAHIETLKAEVARLDALAAEHRADLRQDSPLTCGWRSRRAMARSPPPFMA
ncbi:hypothetical protein [Alsobacter sp. SYSU BS001988]